MIVAKLDMWWCEQNDDAGTCIALQIEEDESLDVAVGRHLAPRPIRVLDLNVHLRTSVATLSISKVDTVVLLRGMPEYYEGLCLR
jgi:hypothetical protein